MQISHFCSLIRQNNLRFTAIFLTNEFCC